MHEGTVYKMNQTLLKWSMRTTAERSGRCVELHAECLLYSVFQMATRRAYGLALAKLGQASQRVVALDGDTKNSTFSETFKKAFPERYIECFIAEQNMVRCVLVFK